MDSEDFLESLSKYETFELIKHLDISNKNIKNLEFLPKNLEVLNCSHNQITYIPELPETLTELNCSNNQISSLSNLPKNLKILDCSHNQINNLDIPDNIEELNYDNNLLEGYPIFKPKMKLLSANQNLLTEFDYSKIPRTLRKIYLNDNKITSFPRIYGPINKNIILELKNNPIIINGCKGRCMYNIIFKEDDPDFDFKAKFIL